MEIRVQLQDSEQEEPLQEQEVQVGEEKGKVPVEEQEQEVQVEVQEEKAKVGLSKTLQILQKKIEKLRALQLQLQVKVSEKLVQVVPPIFFSKSEELHQLKLFH